MENENMNYTISAHCKQRYAERIRGKEDIDINRFVTLNEDKIKTDINKMIQYGEFVYSGNQTQKDGKTNLVDVFIKDCWVVIADSKQKNVITLYKIDFGLDDEFNKMYVEKMLEKLNTQKAELKKVQEETHQETEMYRSLIAETDAQIKEYRGMIKNLEELLTSYKTIIENNHVKVTQSNRNVAEIINTMINKKEF